MTTTTVTSSPTTVNIGLLSPQTVALGTTGLTAVTVNVIGLLSGIEIDGSAGSNVTINNAVNLGSALHLNTDGADFILNSSVLSANALSGTTVDINDGGTFQTSGTLIAANVLSGASVSFGTGGGTDLITNSGSFLALNLLSSTGPIAGFDSSADVIDDQALDFAHITGYTVSGTSGGTETIAIHTSGTSSLTFAIDHGTFTTGTYAANAGPLQLSSDGTGLKVTVCFLAGTMIATPDGEVAVETLKPGDLVLTADGRSVPVRWLGINTVSTRFAEPQRSLPVRITAGALGRGLPRRDLLLSPDHAVLVGGVLAQAAALVDGAGIRRETAMPEIFRYYHVETAAHDLILAEGTPAETFVDNVSRMAFDNWAEFLEICGGEPPTGEMDYPRVKSFRQLPPALRQQLAAEVEMRAKSVA
jgi:hypothetical protein